VSGNALTRVDALHKQVYRKRHDVNLAADTQAKHAAELKKALPSPAPEGSDWKTEYARLQAEAKQVAKRQEDTLSAIRKIFEEEKDAATREYEQAVEAATKHRETRIESARAEANQAAAKVREEEGPKVARLTADLATNEERSRAAAQAEGTRQAAALAEKTAADSRQESQQLTEALERLAQLKLTVAGRLPIKGITIEDGRIVHEENGSNVPSRVGIPRRRCASASALRCWRMAMPASFASTMPSTSTRKSARLCSQQQQSTPNRMVCSSSSRRCPTSRCR
jgi:hypothetical protein